MFGKFGRTTNEKIIVIHNDNDNNDIYKDTRSWNKKPKTYEEHGVKIKIIKYFVRHDKCRFSSHNYLFCGFHGI